LILFVTFNIKFHNTKYIITFSKSIKINLCCLKHYTYRFISTIMQNNINNLSNFRSHTDAHSRSSTHGLLSKTYYHTFSKIIKFLTQNHTSSSEKWIRITHFLIYKKLNLFWNFTVRSRIIGLFQNFTVLQRHENKVTTRTTAKFYCFNLNSP
jgi:hypothetical protein